MKTVSIDYSCNDRDDDNVLDTVTHFCKHGVYWQMASQLRCNDDKWCKILQQVSRTPTFAVRLYMWCKIIQSHLQLLAFYKLAVECYFESSHFMLGIKSLHLWLLHFHRQPGARPAFKTRIKDYSQYIPTTWFIRTWAIPISQSTAIISKAFAYFHRKHVLNMNFW